MLGRAANRKAAPSDRRRDPSDDERPRARRLPRKTKLAFQFSVGALMVGIVYNATSLQTGHVAPFPSAEAVQQPAAQAAIVPSVAPPVRMAETPAASPVAIAHAPVVDLTPTGTLSASAPKHAKPHPHIAASKPAKHKIDGITAFLNAKPSTSGR